MSTTHSLTYARTDQGRTEITSPKLKLARPARNLLLMIDASHTGEEWVRKVNGSTLSDLDLLISAQLIATNAGSGANFQAERIPVEAALLNWKYDALYALLTGEAKSRFGLVKGYMLVLKIESCADLAGLQAVALDFVEQLRKAHGEEAAARFRKQLGATD